MKVSTVRRAIPMDDEPEGMWGFRDRKVALRASIGKELRGINQKADHKPARPAGSRKTIRRMTTEGNL